jgi:hypothetical protein
MFNPLLLNVTPNTKFLITTNAVGGDYLEKWRNLSSQNWINYAERFDIGLAIFTEDIIDLDSQLNKVAPWQKLLLTELMWNRFPNLNKIALIDTDVIFSPFARNIFDYSGQTGIGAVSQIKNLPFDLDQVKRRVAFLRHNFFSPDYPLDSELFATPQQFFKNRGLPIFNDYFCSGVVVINDQGTSMKLSSWYERITRKESEAIREMHGTWEEPYLNVWAQDELNVNWMPYSFQALWNYEMAWYHPHSYNYPQEANGLASLLSPLESTLIRNDLLHFAGGWNESLAWNLVPELFANVSSINLAELSNYLGSELTGKPLGKILPT